MSSTPNKRVNPGPPRPSQQSDNRGSAPSFDPIKLLHKYKYILLFAIFAGGAIGVASHFFFLQFFPKFRSTVLFECSPVQTDISVRNVEEIDEDEMARFIGTQVEMMRGERVRTEVLEDPRLAAEAPDWYSKYERRGRFDVVEAYEDIEKVISARAIPNTYFVELSVSVGKKEDAAGLVRLVRENYLRILNQGNSTDTTQQREQLRKSISDADTRVTELMNRRNRFLQEMNMNTADTQESAEAEMLRLINAQILGLQQQVEAYEIILQNDESQLQKDTAIVYDMTLRQQVEQYRRF
jgi:uncharacterized protein involved in exopolysaccharide biosynthesis